MILNDGLKNYLHLGGSDQFWNPVANLNDFYTGIALFSDGVVNMPTSGWFLVISAGTSTIRMQIAWHLNTGKKYFRNAIDGVMNAWQVN